MKKIIYIHINRLMLACAAVILILFSACVEKEDGLFHPVITEIRNYAPAPNDTLIQSLQPGQWVVLTGRNLTGATDILFNGVSAVVNNGLFSDNYAVVQVPGVIPFPLVPTELLNTVRYITNKGLTTYSFEISAPAPAITRISNENANAGDSVVVFGSNLFMLNKFSFAGTEITEYKSSPDGTFVSFKMPEITGSGPVVVENNTGGYSTPFNVNDPTGTLCNFDDVNTFGWGANIVNNNPLYPSSRGNFAVLQNNGLNAGNSSWWEGGRSMNTNPVQWIPQASLSDAVSEYVFKFEINVPGEWNGATLLVLKDFNWGYVARYEPWRISSSRTSPFTTEGNWITVTIPFSEFRNKPQGGKDGTGLSIASLKDLLGDSGNGSLSIFIINDSSEATAAMNIAIDNLRVVKVIEPEEEED
ncbi:glycan-binding surface protein [Belliella marina]|uniref:Glycan-binding surface protein n=1 Tax=Belliella marina TaxID=1644146 RepID=A0ABW4VMH0_9BACT